MFIRWFYEYVYYSDHIIKTKFHYNTKHIDQLKRKYEGGGGTSAPKAPPLDLRLHRDKLTLYHEVYIAQFYRRPS